MMLKKEDLFLIFIYLNTFCKGIGLGNDSKIYLILILFGLVILFYKIITESYTKRQIAFVGSLVLIGVLNLAIASKITLLLTGICIAGMKKVDSERMFRGIYQIRLVTFIAMVVLSLSGIIENNMLTMWRNGVLNVRYDFGYGHPNTAHINFFILVSLYIYLNHHKMNFVHYAIVGVLNLVVYHYTVSRTGLFVTTLLLLFAVFSRIHSRSIRTFLCRIPKYAYAATAVLSFGLSYLYDKIDFVKGLDRIFNGRLSYGNYYLNNFGLSLWGNNLIGDNGILDNGYLVTYIQCGLCGFLSVSIMFFLIAKFIERTEDISKAVLVSVYAVYFISEGFLPNIFMNIPLLYFGLVLFPENKKIIENGNKMKNTFNTDSAFYGVGKAAIFRG